MNPYPIVILLALIVPYALLMAADVLNLRALDPEVPSEFAAIYDAERYRRSQEYTRVTTQFGWLRDSFQLVVLLVFWLAGGFAWLDSWTRSLGWGPVVTGLIFIAVLLIAQALLGLPFRCYATFVIEERFGFNKTTARTFVIDTVKGVLLGVALGGPLLACILWFFQATGATAWLWCWAVATAFTLVVQFVAPTWIMPLFNEFRPLEEGELRTAVMDYAARVSFPLAGLFVIDGSRRSTKANAFFTGFGERKRVALFDTLIAKHSVAELVAIVAHEIGHYKRHHIQQGLALSIAQFGLMFFLLSLFLRDQQLSAAFGVTQPSVHTGLVFFLLLLGPIDLVLGLFLHAFSRHNEFEADAFARQTIGRGDELASALAQLSADNLQNLTPHPLYVKLHYSHPPVLQRIASLRAVGSP